MEALSNALRETRPKQRQIKMMIVVLLLCTAMCGDGMLRSAIARVPKKFPTRHRVALPTIITCGNERTSILSPFRTFRMNDGVSFSSDTRQTNHQDRTRIRAEDVYTQMSEHAKDEREIDAYRNARDVILKPFALHKDMSTPRAYDTYPYQPPNMATIWKFKGMPLFHATTFELRGEDGGEAAFPDGPAFFAMDADFAHSVAMAASVPLYEFAMKCIGKSGGCDEAWWNMRNLPGRKRLAPTTYKLHEYECTTELNLLRFENFFVAMLWIYDVVLQIREAQREAGIEGDPIGDALAQSTGWKGLEELGYLSLIREQLDPTDWSYAADTHVVDALHSLVRFLGSEEHASMLANQRFDMYDPQSCMIKQVEFSKIASIEGAVTYVHGHVEVVLFEPEKSLKVTKVTDQSILGT